MVEYYVYNVEHGYKKWTKVNKLWREEVKQRVIEDGYTLNDDGTVSKTLNDDGTVSKNE